ncbi:MAG: DeoR/GlpR transcriptional regulator [Acidobacteriaceae bacterium]|nr:DeoR/GlpR transcriptional regulator [Acidobacteriaceae bacterium]MBV9780346.1 DeoR/GlpR transcriptional regulator [Acidobacteriaceae bacterium]
MPPAKNSRLLAEERRRKILQIIDKDGQVTITDLAGRFGVSAVTVRADLDALSTNGIILRSHGGAVKREQAPDYPLRLKETLHRSEKIRIGRAAAELVRPGETIILDSGTTTAEIAAHLKELKLNPLTVITHALNIALELADAPGISVIVIGGLLRPVSHSLVGPQAEAMLKDLHADRFFLAVDGFDVQAGPSTPDVLEAQLNGSMARVAKEITVVADSSKLGRQSVSRIGPMKQIDRLITDRRAPAEFTDALRKRGIQVTLV